VADLLAFAMPSLGADMEVGTVLEWRVGPGDEVQPGDIVALVDTEKAEIEVEIWDAGVIDRLVVPVGEQVPVGTVIAELRLAGVPAPAMVPATAVVAPPPAVPEPAPAAHPQPHVVSPLVRHLAETRHLTLDEVRGSGPGGRVLRADVEAGAAMQPPARPRVSPRARRLAAEHGIDIAAAGPGSGPAGALIGDDILALAAAPPAAPPAQMPTAAPAEMPAAAPAVTPAAARAATPAAARAVTPAAAPAVTQEAAPAAATDRIRQAIAARMTRSWHEIPHYHLATRADVSALLAWLAEVNEARPVRERLLPAAALLHATARAASRHPTVNGWWRDGRFQPAERVDLGVVVALRGGGLAAPCIAGADTLTLEETMARLRDVVSRARTGKLRSSDTAEASLTVTNLGDLGVDSVFGVIHPPQVALVGIGSIHEEPWAAGGMVGARPVVHLSLAGDHRASDGLAGAAFLATLSNLLGRPEQLTPGGTDVHA
jgi:pyruvate dehydrogenase E2 component (dihydrolipoamide acetyltransferase)